MHEATPDRPPGGGPRSGAAPPGSDGPGSETARDARTVPGHARAGGSGSAADQPGTEPDHGPDYGAGEPGQAGPGRSRSGRPLQPGVLTVIAVLLTIGTAAADVLSFTRLGSVFASVMTSNIVFLGLAAARESPALAGHAAVSFAGYVVGVAAGTRLARSGSRPAEAGRGQVWSSRIALALAAEIAVLGVFTAGWAVTGARPAGGAQLFLLAMTTVAMGIQSAVVVTIGIAGVSTTYMTGTLTTLIEALAHPDRRKGADVRRFSVIGALMAGAGLSGLLLVTAPAAVPAIPLAVLFGVIAAGSGLLGPGQHPHLPHRPHRPGKPAGRPRDRAQAGS